MARPHLRELTLTPTPAAWLDTVLSNFPAFLKDHASCEKKASGMALNVASHYPDRPRLLNAMAELAAEELAHYREVVRLMTSRGVTPGPDTKDPYVNALNGAIRRGTAQYLLDRLLVGAVIERRGQERFALLARALPNETDRAFYEAIAESEAQHWVLFVELARAECPEQAIDRRLAELVALEADLVAGMPLRAALH